MSARRTAPRRAYDVVLYGATGFVGRQTVAYFAAQSHGLRWALAGRSAPKLEQLREACGAGAAGAGIIVADAADAPALQTLAAQATVVLSTAGPFALHGSALVAACVAQRSHYVDITGETPWVRGLIAQHHAQAEREGTRIIPCCGFDSVPSDLGAWLVAQAIRRQFGEPCVSVKACHSMRGGVNGGTLASLFNVMEAGQSQQLADPFLLNPPGTAPRNSKAHADPVAPHHDAEFDAWVGPFVMGAINTRVVRRSVALLAARGDMACAPEFSYQEYLRVGRGPVAAGAAATLSLGLGWASWRWASSPGARWLAHWRPRLARGPLQAAWTAARSAANWWAPVRAASCCADALPAKATPATAPQQSSSANLRWRWPCNSRSCQAARVPVACSHRPAGWAQGWRSAWRRWA